MPKLTFQVGKFRKAGGLGVEIAPPYSTELIYLVFPAKRPASLLLALPAVWLHLLSKARKFH
jgi:hypothetical protein